MVTYGQFAARCEAVLGRIHQACAAAGRSPDSVRLLPVTKTHQVEAAEYSYRFGLPAVAASPTMSMFGTDSCVSVCTA